jgi:aminopeptidase C
MDDHGMHVTGLVEDQNGTKYFIVKNSWGESNDWMDISLLHFHMLNIRL